MPQLHPTKSKKQKKLIALPGEFMSRVVIPNRLVNAEYSYTLMQERIFNYVMHYLQHYIQQIISGTAITQLDMFQNNQERINISIPLMTISKPAYYDRARDAAKELATIMVSIPVKHDNKPYERVRGLFEWVDVPDQEKRQRSGVLQVSMSKQVAEMLVDIEVRQGVPREYTAFLFEVTMACRNKYTPRIYKQLCSWKKRGKCYMSLQEINQWLCLGSKYKTYAGLKQHVLKPVMQELKKFADVWFDVDDPEFEVKEGTKVVGLWFQVHTPDQNLRYVKLKESIVTILKQHFRLSSEDITKLDPVLQDVDNYSSLQYKILELSETIRSRRDIRSVPAYVVKSLLTYHKPR